MHRAGARFGAADAWRARHARLVPRPDNFGELGIIDVFNLLSLELTRPLDGNAVLVLVGVDARQIRVAPRRPRGCVGFRRRLLRRHRVWATVGMEADTNARTIANGIVTTDRFMGTLLSRC